MQSYIYLFEHFIGTDDTLDMRAYFNLFIQTIFYKYFLCQGGNSGETLFLNHDNKTPHSPFPN